MGRFDVTLCLGQPPPGSVADALTEERFKLALSGPIERVDHVLCGATPQRISSDIAASVRSAPAFSHQMNVLVGIDESREILLTLFQDLTRQQQQEQQNDDSHDNSNNDDHSDDVPLQCMFFAFDGTSVLCEIIGHEEMGSVMEVMHEMPRIVLCALKFRRRAMTFVVVEQLSTTLIASMLGCTWCNVWIVAAAHMPIDGAVSVLREALSVRDAVHGFRQFPAGTTVSVEGVGMLLCSRAASDGEAEHLFAAWQRYTQRDETTSTSENNNNSSSSSSSRPTVDESAALRIIHAEFQVLLKEREEYFTDQIKEKEDEITHLRHALQEDETNRRKLREAEVRIKELETQFVEMYRGSHIQRKYLDTSEAEAGKRIQHTKGMVFSTQVEEVCDKMGTSRNENAPNSSHQRELCEMQAALRDMQQKWEELKEENLQNAMEFHEREKEWQAELKRREEELHAVTQQCCQLRSVVLSQVSDLDVVKGVIQSTEMLREQELDNLLNKIRAISSASASVSHRRASPRRKIQSDARNRHRMTSPSQF